MLRALLAPLTLLPLLLAGPTSHAYVVLTPGAPGPLLRALHVTPTRVYERGFAARLSAEAVRALPRGVVAEPDRQLTVAATTQGDASWGLDRIDQRSLPLNHRYRSPNGAASVHAYVIDTGIEVSHRDFGGRAHVAYDALGGDGRDCNGHGTHVAGIVGGTTYGVAKQVTLEAVRVMDCSGRSSTSAVLAGVEWVRRNAVRPAVANLSLGGALSTVLDRAVDDLVDSGVVVTVAAGNDGGDACSSSPAAASEVLAVAASDRNDTRAPWSDTGSCVDLFAPGAAITSDWLGGRTRVASGTSMASPFVAGAAALYLERHPTDPAAAVAAWLTGHATTGRLRSVPRGTPDRLLYTSAAA